MVVMPNVWSRPDGGQSPPAPVPANPRFRTTVPPTCAFENRFDLDVTTPWNWARVACPAVDANVNWSEATVVPRPPGEIHVKVPVPLLPRSIAVEQLMLGDLNDADNLACCTYGPVQTPNVAAS